MKNAGRSFGLDIMRGLAIVLVLVSHFVHKWEILGFWGVEIFFALSGFLIGRILWRSFTESKDWKIEYLYNFWSRRWWRTLPNYYLFLFVSLLSLKPFYLPSSRFLWFGQDLTFRDLGFYSVSWSLCVEEWFYFLFPALLFGISRIKRVGKSSFVACIIIFIVSSIIGRNFLPTDNLRCITLARLDSITYGVAASFIFYTYKLKSSFVNFLSILGVMLLISPLYLSYLTNFTLSQLIQKSFILAAVPFGAALILPFASNIPELRVKPIATIITKLSLWSYSIYLSHIPILFTTYALFDKYRFTVFGNIVSKFLGLCLTIIASALIYNYFEIPLMAKRPKELAGIKINVQ